MNHYSRLGRNIGSFVILLFLTVTSINAEAQNGQALFAANCASCHQVNKRLVGPALANIEERGPWTDRKELYAWIHNPAGYMKTDPYTAGLFKEYGGVMMQAFPGLSNAEIDAILDYIKAVPVADAKSPAGGEQEAAAQASDNTLLFGILTLILAIVSFVLLQVNSNLKKLADDKEGLGGRDPLPFWRNKAYIAFVCVLLFLVGGYLTVQGAIGLGRSQHYEPEQPIFYSHQVHAGTNQISCFYCHGNTELGKQANIPSVNICMNCHLGINEYTGPDKLIDGDGNERDGTAEIQKLYKYAGYEFGKLWDVSKAQPIPWVRIHNLPDHVYFNHAQHVKVGKVACQTCHGEIQNMHEVYQFSDLSMGWCVNCHRNTQVQFKDNGFYSIYEQYHEKLKNGTLDSTNLTVEKMGGTECQRCHY